LVLVVQGEVVVMLDMVLDVVVVVNNHTVSMSVSVLA
jgi:hypothetical protein